MKLHTALISAAIALLGTTALISLEGCDNTAKSNDSIAFEHLKSHATYRLVDSATDYESAADLSFDCSADMLMPTSLFGHDVVTLQDSILSAAFDTTATKPHDIIASSFRRMAAEVGFAVADTTVADSSYDGLYTVEGMVESLSPTVLCYAVTVSNYMPRAAHGMYWTRFVNYDLADGKVFTLSDIFTREGLEKLPSLLRQTATSMRGSIGQTDLTALPADNNFCINGDGEIVFVYQPYEIASYAQGIIRIPVASYILSDYFTPYGNKLLMGVE